MLFEQQQRQQRVIDVVVGLGPFDMTGTAVLPEALNQRAHDGWYIIAEGQGPSALQVADQTFAAFAK